jgi:hypothetical protein
MITIPHGTIITFRDAPIEIRDAIEFCDAELAFPPKVR